VINQELHLWYNEYLLCAVGEKKMNIMAFTK